MFVVRQIFWLLFCFFYFISWIYFTWIYQVNESVFSLLGIEYFIITCNTFQLQYNFQFQLCQQLKIGQIDEQRNMKLVSIFQVIIIFYPVLWEKIFSALLQSKANIRLEVKICNSLQASYKWILLLRTCMKEDSCICTICLVHHAC